MSENKPRPLAELLGKIRGWASSKEAYTCRFGLEMLMTHFLDEDFEAELLSGRSPADAMKTASAAAAICVTRRGAAPSIPLRAEVETAMRSAPVLPTVAPHPPESLQAIK